jgi:hypothetical protein
MNYYSGKTGPQHLLFGRVAPICEASYRAIVRASGKELPPPGLCAAMPLWAHNIADKLALTIFRRVIELNPKGEIDAQNYGRLVGSILRGVVHFCKEVPAQLKKEGLMDLTKDQEEKVDVMVDFPALLGFASQKFGQPMANEEELGTAVAQRIEKRAKEHVIGLQTFLIYLLDRPITEQHVFLCGIPEGFTMFLNNDGGYSGQRQRTEVYLHLLGYWPEIVEMQQSEPPKTRKFLLDWLEKEVGKQLVEDEKQFRDLCGEIGLVMAPPGHPHSTPAS